MGQTTWRCTVFICPVHVSESKPAMVQITSASDAAFFGIHADQHVARLKPVTPQLFNTPVHEEHTSLCAACQCILAIFYFYFCNVTGRSYWINSSSYILFTSFIADPEVRDMAVTIILLTLCSPLRSADRTQTHSSPLWTFISPSTTSWQIISVPSQCIVFICWAWKGPKAEDQVCLKDLKIKSKNSS